MNVRQTADGVVVGVRVIPRASCTTVEKLAGGELRVKVTAPPVDSAANEAVIEAVAAYFGLPRRQVEVIGGHKSRQKNILLRGCRLDAVADN